MKDFVGNRIIITRRALQHFISDAAEKYVFCLFFSFVIGFVRI